MRGQRGRQRPHRLQLPAGARQVVNCLDWLLSQHSEQFRAGLVLVRGAGPTWMAIGSASLTRRDLDDYALALDAALSGAPSAAPVAAAQEFFDRLWNDRGPPGIEFTADADTWADPSQLRYWTYRVMELLGISRS